MTTQEQAAALRANGLTQREVAKQVGVSLRTVKRWEGAKGDRVPPEGDTKRCQGAKVPEGDMSPRGDIAQATLAKIVSDLVQQVASLAARVSALEAERAESAQAWNATTTNSSGFRPHWVRDKDAQTFTE